MSETDIPSKARKSCVCKLVVLKHELASESPGGLVETQVLGSHIRFLIL